MSTVTHEAGMGHWTPLKAEAEAAVSHATQVLEPSLGPVEKHCVFNLCATLSARHRLLYSADVSIPSAHQHQHSCGWL